MIHLLLLFVLADVSAPIEKYKTAIEDVQANRKGAIQRAFEAALAVRAALAGEELNEPVPGLNAHGAIDPAFFADLAEKHGTAADVDFFKTWKEARAGCTRFDELLAQYKAWFAFSRKHNPNWRAHVIEGIERVERELTTATCACDDAAAVRRALVDTVRDFPLGKVTPRLRQRIQDIDKGSSDIRFSCDPSADSSAPSPAPSAAAFPASRSAAAL